MENLQNNTEKRIKTINIEELYHALLDMMGPQGWWPAENKPEIILGAILVQNTNWLNVLKSLKNLKEVTNYSSLEIKKIKREQLEALIRPSGFYKNKARAIKRVFQFFDEYSWDYKNINTIFGNQLREKLLSLHGVGFETADVLLVYVFDRPVFIADNYARKLFGYLSQKEYKTYVTLHKEILLPSSFSYEDAQEFHGLIDEFGKKYFVKNVIKTNFLEGKNFVI